MGVTSEAPLGVSSGLFSRGERLGWEFRDRHLYWRWFSVSRPRPLVPDPAIEWHILALKLKQARVSQFTAVVSVALVLLTWALSSNSVNGDSIVAVSVTLTAVLLCLSVGIVALLAPALYARPLALGRHSLAQATKEAARQSQLAVSAWEALQVEYNASERARVDGLAEWGAVRIGGASRRIDVYGGNLWGWEAFLTVYGSSMLAECPPVTILDLSGEAVCKELTGDADRLPGLAREANFLVHGCVLPRDLAKSDLLLGLDKHRLADLLIESIHGEESGETRTERMMDSRIIRSICEVIAPDLSMERLFEAVRALMREPDERKNLSRQEWDTIVTRLFSAEYVQQAHQQLRRLEAHIHPLRRLGMHPPARPHDSQLEWIGIQGEDFTVLSDLLIDLIVQWALREVSRSGSVGTGTLIVAGADRLKRRHLERLSDRCEREGVRLFYLFRHLREDALELLGSRATGFMRLGSGEEAERAANFIGRGHKFVRSQISRSQTGGTTHSLSLNEGESIGNSSGSSQGINRSLMHSSTSSSSNWGTSYSRNWGSAESTALTTNWHYGETDQRVYEFRVEPNELQALSDYEIFLVQFTPRGPQSLLATCNPDTLTLPRVSVDPLPDLGPPTNRSALAALERLTAR